MPIKLEIWTNSSDCKSLVHCSSCRLRWDHEFSKFFGAKPRCPRKLQRLWAWATGKKPKVVRWGDRVHTTCRVLGINRVTTWLEGKGINCGCKNRRLMMNQLGLMGWAGYAWKQRKKRDEQTA